MNRKLKNIKWMPPNNGTEELMQLTKLNIAKEKLMSLMESISEEIEQTNLEWNQLKNILNPKAEPFNKLHQDLEIEQRNIDDETVNNMELDLSVGVSKQNRVFSEEEDDYDDEF
ncbi:uncharacterized protein LOC109539263 [Dendroctonus ponderosae]